MKTNAFIMFMNACKKSSIINASSRECQDLIGKCTQEGIEWHKIKSIQNWAQNLTRYISNLLNQTNQDKSPS